MNWETYSNNFQKAATADGLSSKNIERCLNYANVLFEKKLPVIFDRTHLSYLVGYRLKYLQGAAYSSEHFYRTFEIPKKSGDTRTIAEPLPSLKEIQEWILHEILEYCPVSPFAKAYVRGRSIKENARFHVGQKLVLTIDIKDFFGSINTSRVTRLFRNLGYSKSVSEMLAQLCTLDNSLPQGAPSSPAISNICMYQTDCKIGQISQYMNIRYTRYSDDMTFSGEFESGKVIGYVKALLEEEGLAINHLKTRTRQQHQQQEVTGVVVNSRLKAPRKMRRQLRQAVYYLEKYGLANHLQFIGEDRANYISHLLGIANFILFIDPKDSETKQYSEILKSYLPSKY